MNSTRTERAILVARDLFDVELVRVNNPALDAAAALEPADLRSLDVIHLATAQLFGRDLGVVVTYDERMIAAAEKLWLPTNSPC